MQLPVALTYENFDSETWFEDESGRRSNMPVGVMQIEEELSQVLPQKGMMLTIGTFDGVHVGHKYLIAQLRAYARIQNLLSGVITFKQNPKMVVNPQSRIMSLTSITHRVDLLKQEGVDYVIPLSFTPEVAELSAREFVSLLKRYLKMKGLVVGYDFALGKNKEGDYEEICKIGEEMNFQVIEACCRRMRGEIVSSTAIRNVLTHGDRATAVEMLGWNKEKDISRICQ
jgi:riboflavin kinase/FMN adenylyltransferase